ncbi:MAG: penicillin acylase family protein [Pyrinomonadaceae bacterium]
MKRFALLLAALLLSATTLLGQDSDMRLKVAGLKSEVKVGRDGRGIPYIDAKNDADAYFAQGYATASDRLWQMDMMRRLARGETAEIFGRSVLEEDKRWRRFNFSKIASESVKYLSADLKLALESYARGVNAYIASLNSETMPIEFRILQYTPREWQITDTIVVGKILSDALSSTWRNDLLRASLQVVPKEKLFEIENQVTPYDVVLFGDDAKPARQTSRTPGRGASPTLLAAADADDELRSRSLARVGFHAEDLAASNNWVISGKRTADGKPILANDPHLSPTAPGIWYLTHLSTPTMRVSGVTFPGVPGIVLGHNESIAWGATNVGPDVQDIYIETFNEKGEYQSPSGWQMPVTRTEVIKVRQNPLKPETESVNVNVVETRNGPVILEADGKKYTLKWTAFEPRNGEFEVFYKWNRAKNWGEFTDSLKAYGGSAQNFVYADVKGNIGWYAASKIPIRRVGDGALPYDGSTTDGEWTGVIPFAELPHVYNPKSGLIVTANQRIVGTSYKYTQMSRDAAAPWRARRILNLLEAKPKLTMDDVAAVQHDAYNIPLANLAKEIVDGNAASPQTLAVLKGWDGKMSHDSRAALLVNEIRICVGNKIAEVNKPIPGYVIRERVLDRAVKEKSALWLPSRFAAYGDLLKSCDTAVRAMYSDPKRYGPNDVTWTWGTAWKSRFAHPLAIAPLIGGQFATPNVPIDGSGQTPNVGSGVSMRHIASPGNWDATRHVIPLGQSGNPRSPHYKDQFALWSTGMPAIFPFSRQAVASAMKTTMTMSPPRD